MSKSMLINVTHPEESRVAIVDNGTLDGFEIETVQHGQLKGNVYKGIVRNVNSALQAAFVEFGASRDGFLPLDEVNYQVLPARQGRQKGKGHRIEDHLKSGLKVVVQVVKDGFGSKPPTLSTFISLPGRYLVLTPDSDAGGVSRKIGDQKQRDRLRKILSELKTPEGSGVIVRTAGTDQTKTELGRDLRYLVRLWQNIEAAAQTIRDYLTTDIKEIWIDDESVYRRAEHWFKAVMPTKRKMLRQYQGAAPLFTKHNIEEQIEQIFKRRVNLPSGGSLVIDSTEALTAVDVNSGKYRKSGNIEDTALQTNLEAAAEIARQLRLRDLGGIIVIDFIDMRSRRNIRAVEKVVRDSMKGDKAKHDITSISKLGLMEISRQRMKPTKAASTFVDCDACGGDGRLRSVESAALSALRKIHAQVARGNLDSLHVRMQQEVANHLLNQKREELGELERRHRCRIVIEPDPALGREAAEFEAGRRDQELRPAGTRRREEGRANGNGKRRRGGRGETPVAVGEQTAAVSEEAVLEGLDDRGAEPKGKEAPQKKRRRRSRPRKPAQEEAEARAEPAPEEATEEEAAGAEAEEQAQEGTAPARKRRRRRRGGRGRRGRGKAETGAAAAEEESATPDSEPDVDEAAEGDRDESGGERPAADGPGLAAASEAPAPGVEILVPEPEGDHEPYVPPSMSGRPQEAPDQPDEADRGSWWSRFRRVIRNDADEGS
ncbi:MAG: Rne/Rng family ribonuclease [Acidobacteriota bacterium]|jgi:ribonuclease E